MIQEWTKKVKAKNEKEPSGFKYVWKVRWSPSKGFYMKRIELLELVSRLIDIILCVNDLSTLLLLTIVKPYLSTNKQLHYINT